MGVTPKSRKVLSWLLTVLAATILAGTISYAADWTIETVDQSGPGRTPSLKVDRDGNVHVAYVPDIGAHPLKYAYWDHKIGRWFTMTVAGGASFCTLALDSKQMAHISYSDNGTVPGTKLRYAHWDGKTWKVEAISPPGNSVVAYYTGIALNAKDEPSFTFYDYQGPGGADFTLRLRSVFRRENFWEVHVVDRARGSGKFNALAMDSKGHPHAAYANVRYETSGLRYAYWDGEEWKNEILEGATAPHPVLSVNLTLDKNDIPHIVYTDATNRQVKYATKKNGAWQIYVVDRLVKEGFPDRYGIDLDEDGNPYLSYFDLGTGAVKVAYVRDGKWYGEVVNSSETGFTSSIQVRNGVIWLAYADDVTGSLKVAHRPIEAIKGPPVPAPPRTAQPGSVAKNNPVK